MEAKTLAERAKLAEELYNRYRAPEARAKLVKVDGNTIVYMFEGTFCDTCGMYDWIEDMKYVLEDVGVEAEVEAAEERSTGGPTCIFMARFRVRGLKEPRREVLEVLSGEAE